MNKLHCIETFSNLDRNYSGSFLIEPLQTGQGITLGNTLRRTLLSDLSGFSITGVKINNLKHEFSILNGIREDVLEILLNLKEIIFKGSLIKEKNPLNIKGFLNVKGPKIVTAGMFYLPKNILKILNPEQYICTIVDNSEIYLEINIENGIGYRLNIENLEKDDIEKFSIIKPTTLSIDSTFMPVKNVNYKIKLIYDSKGNIKESLLLNIVTNGSITPKRSLQEAIKILMNLFYPIFLNLDFISLSSTFIKNWTF